MKQNALNFPFEKPNQSKLVSRLKDICKIEKVEAESNVLATLCDMTENDIRACINTLQVPTDIMLTSSLVFHFKIKTLNNGQSFKARSWPERYCKESI